MILLMRENIKFEVPTCMYVVDGRQTCLSVDRTKQVCLCVCVCVCVCMLACIHA